MDTAVQQAKEELRRRHLDRRRELGPDDLRHADLEIAYSAVEMPWLRPGDTVAAYLSFGAEPPTGVLLSMLLTRRIRVLVPRCEGEDLVWVPWSGPESETRVGAVGAPEPTDAPAAGGLASCTCVLVPALAADRHGGRLGRGRGFYDRALAGLPRLAAGGPPLVGVLYDEELVDAVPVEPHDVPVDHVLTPSGVWACEDPAQPRGE